MRQNPRYLKGLSSEQRERVKRLLPSGAADDNHRAGANEGWWLYRLPTTINPPTTLRLHKRDSEGRLLQMISITENGVTK